MFSVTRHTEDFDSSDKSGHDPEELFHITSVNLIVVGRCKSRITLRDERHVYDTEARYDVDPAGRPALVLFTEQGNDPQQHQDHVRERDVDPKHMDLTDKRRSTFEKLIRSSHKGIRKLQTTYIKDVNVVARLAAMVSSTTGDLYDLPKSRRSLKRLTDIIILNSLLKY